jgi:hypothetical protein
MLACGSQFSNGFACLDLQELFAGDIEDSLA